MADEAKAVRAKAEKSAWTPDPATNKDAKIYSRSVKATANVSGEKVPVSFTQVKLNKSVKDLTEAATTLKVKGSRAIKALVDGVNKSNRKMATDDYSTIATYAERKSITFEQAKAKLEL